MRVFHLYDLASGTLLGRTHASSMLDMEPPPQAGIGFIEDVRDWEGQRVDLATGQLVDFTPVSPSSEEAMAGIAAAVRAERDGRLGGCDWVVARAMETGEPIPDAWRHYRAALRDVPLQAGFPSSIAWPQVPS